MRLCNERINKRREDMRTYSPIVAVVLAVVVVVVSVVVVVVVSVVEVVVVVVVETVVEVVVVVVVVVTVSADKKQGMYSRLNNLSSRNAPNPNRLGLVHVYSAAVSKMQQRKFF